MYLGGGRINSISCRHVTRENITYKCNHQLSSSSSGKRAQSMIVPRRRVIPCEAVLVRNFACDTWKPQRLMVYFCVLEKDIFTSTAGRNHRLRASFSAAFSFSTCGRQISAMACQSLLPAYLCTLTQRPDGRYRGLKTLPGAARLYARLSSG